MRIRKVKAAIYGKDSDSGRLEIKQYKKELKRIDWDIVKRLVELLYYENRMKRTNIALKCNLSYGNCLLYLNWLEMLEFVKKETDNEGFELVSLDEKGMDLYRRQMQTA